MHFCIQVYPLPQRAQSNTSNQRHDLIHGIVGRPRNGSNNTK